MQASVTEPPYRLTNDEYRTVAHFENITRYKPDDRLLKYGKTVLLSGTLVLGYYLIGLDVRGLSGAFIQATIKRPELVPVFLVTWFLYNFYRFDVHLRHAISIHNFKIDNLRSFGQSVARYIIRKEIGRYFQSTGIDHSYEPKNLSDVGSNDEIVMWQFTLDKEIRAKHDDEISKLPGFLLDRHTVKFEYRITNADRQFYEANKDYLRTIGLHEFMDYRFPRNFGIVVSVMILLFQVISVFA